MSKNHKIALKKREVRLPEDGKHFNVILGDLKQSDDLRVLDYDGHHVFYNFSLNEVGQPVFHEA